MRSRPRQRRVALDKAFRSRTELVRGILDYQDEQAGHWMLVGNGVTTFVSLPEMMPEFIDGVIASVSDEEPVKHLIESGLPIVNISSAGTYIPLPFVNNDDEEIGRVGGRYLLERGFISFGFVGVPNRPYAQRRLKGFREVVEQEASHPCMILNCQANRWDVNRKEIHCWLQDIPSAMPIAIMACNDQIGRQIVDDAAETGLRVPDDLAVLGVDNDPLSTMMAATPLSSIDVDHRGIGYRAAKMLDQLMDGKIPSLMQWVPPVGVVPRASTEIVVGGDWLVSRALKMIGEQATRGITVADLVGQLTVSRRGFEMHFKRSTGMTPHEAIRRAQIKHAKKMLATSNATLDEVASASGFSQAVSFWSNFKRLTTMPPGAYRKRFGSSRG